MKPLRVLLIALTIAVLTTPIPCAYATIGRSPGTSAQAEADTRSNQCVNDWIPVPAWLAGTWRGKLHTFVERYDHRTKEQTFEQPPPLNSQRRTIGMQQDNSGQIWHYVSSRARKLPWGAFIDYQNVLFRGVVVETEKAVRIRTVATVRRISNQTNQCVDAFEREIITTYVLLDDGVIKVTLETKDLDVTRQPTVTARSIRVEKRVCPFERIDLKGNESLRAKFLQFMVKQTSPNEE